jgi:glucose-6-phosphate 1-epimerase
MGGWLLCRLQRNDFPAGLSMQIITGPLGLDCLRVEHPSGACLWVSCYGGQILSWKTANGRERLFLSESAVTIPGKALRGGVPVIFPQFSDHGPFARHGFARRMEWRITDGGDHAESLLTLASTPETLAEWPYAFEIALGVSLSTNSLSISLTVRNTGEVAFPFQAALHSYLLVENATGCELDGLQSLDYLNEVTKKMEEGEETAIRFGSEVDRAYYTGGSRTLRINDGDQSLVACAKAFPDVVVWNPGPDHGIADLTPEAWRQFLCVEAARLRSEDSLPPGGSWRGTQMLRAE